MKISKACNSRNATNLRYKELNMKKMKIKEGKITMMLTYFETNENVVDLKEWFIQKNRADFYVSRVQGLKPSPSSQTDRQTDTD